MAKQNWPFTVGRPKDVREVFYSAKIHKNPLDISRPNKWKPLPYEEDKSKVPLVVFGEGMFGKNLVKLKGMTGVMWRSLKKREAAGELIAITIVEYETSKVYSQSYFDDLKVIKTPGFKGSKVLCCQKCEKVWQRDVNAARNMMIISKAIWLGEGRPEVSKLKKLNNKPNMFSLSYRRIKHAFLSIKD
ncbi:uncharacterized protein EV154DRAFT_488962 [Mucor mucedo]|uniref:uncharacterized protein n=1 Tax=Mucor mucedo TaxID=29922 RepID=UPI002221119C|nr:uncharacterized protein EV154DRAFT_488962 [Mucor mucedo]KAI7864089.1 hypothetical protein EV154DRAFT_488962 [Mucor mucedo]